MRLGVIAFLLGFLALDVTWAKTTPSADLRAYYGEITKVNLAAKTISLRLGMTFNFSITDETIITGPNGPVRSDKIRPGDGAMVVMRPGPGNVGIAVKIRLHPNADFPGEPSAKTSRGETVSGFAVNSFVVYQPPPQEFNRGLDLGPTRSGMFVLAVRPDGSVTNVAVLKSIGHRELDERAARWLKRSRFRPNSVTEVRMPMSYHRTR